jgi:hypothetical protein
MWTCHPPTDQPFRRYATNISRIYFIYLFYSYSYFQISPKHATRARAGSLNIESTLPSAFVHRRKNSIFNNFRTNVQQLVQRKR